MNVPKCTCALSKLEALLGLASSRRGRLPGLASSSRARPFVGDRGAAAGGKDAAVDASSEAPEPERTLKQTLPAV
eukprot:CAMPEP_0204182560 /NCGR_PEP_ID=MMETSP0361-20130328/52855_1 /ASSEMBLY_ACC=CAM_ASM_000343 /TAXON_ID=268821 /ORGANISM="Scrippsiella Hangoei, Strain SHTV-5" /LENGTH=74 /DNA_ID=CAMNT_0051142315 /DNA_START=275 /DNA_END=495 /DNA_ORIENTATION=-